MHEFKFELNAEVEMMISGERGIILGRCEYSFTEDAYFVRYKTTDGRAAEVWWTDSALQEIPGRKTHV